MGRLVEGRHDCGQAQLETGWSAQDFEAVGMQTLLDTVRGTGAKNVIIAGGLDWAYDFSGILEGRRLADPGGNGVIYANHVVQQALAGTLPPYTPPVVAHNPSPGAVKEAK